MPVFDIDLDGHRWPLSIEDAELAAVHLPVLHDLARQWRQRRGRFIVFLAGPPGSGKTVLANLWQELARRCRLETPVQSLSMDGFHFPNVFLDSHFITIDGVSSPLRRIKGRPETFDLESLRQSLRDLKSGRPARWPSYDRKLHDPLPGAIPVVPEGILVVEGLYMLLDQPGWRELRAEADWGVFVECPEAVLRADLVARKERQGRSHEDAVAHYDFVDHYTFQLITSHRHGIDSVVRVGTDRGFSPPANPPGGF